MHGEYSVVVAPDFRSQIVNADAGWRGATAFTTVSSAALLGLQIPGICRRFCWETVGNCIAQPAAARRTVAGWLSLLGGLVESLQW